MDALAQEIKDLITNDIVKTIVALEMKREKYEK